MFYLAIPLTSYITFIITFLFLIAVSSIDLGIGIAFPEGIPEDTPNIVQMQEVVNALQEYNNIDGLN